jgi:hypothetical protein
MTWLYMGVAAMFVASAALYVDEMLHDKPPQQPDFWDAWFAAPTLNHDRWWAPGGRQRRS